MVPWYPLKFLGGERHHETKVSWTRTQRDPTRTSQSGPGGLKGGLHFLPDSIVCFVNTYPLNSIIQPLKNQGLEFNALRPPPLPP